MKNLLKNLSIADKILLFFLLLFVIVIGLDLSRAINGVQCIGNIKNDCYPWGFEGPIAEIWYYQKKSYYLINNVLGLTVFFGAGLSLLAFPKTRKKTWIVIIALIFFGIFEVVMG